MQPWVSLSLGCWDGRSSVTSSGCGTSTSTVVAVHELTPEEQVTVRTVAANFGNVSDALRKQHARVREYQEAKALLIRNLRDVERHLALREALIVELNKRRPHQ